jgi:hypothetical protein
MPSTLSNTLRLAGFTVTSLTLIFTLACIDRPVKRAVPNPVKLIDVSVPQSTERDVDLLFVIDDSGSMDEEQRMLKSQFTTLMKQLRSFSGGLPNVHIGVTSTDLGAGGTACGSPDGGRLLRGNCPALAEGDAFVVDVEPASCVITKVRVDDRITCPASACTQADCDASEPGTVLATDESGCPRCRNYSGASLEEVFTCMADLGIQGCGFEQPLEAMRSALDRNPSNEGFIRENALLGIVFITDEDDCSASNPGLFEDSLAAERSLGPRSSYRCFEYGITCQPTNDRNALGQRTGCELREDPGAMLHPVSRYVSFLERLKDPQLLVVAAIAGPSQHGEAVVGLDEYGQSAVMPSCIMPNPEDGDAAPAFRMTALVEAFARPEEMAWANLSICSESFVQALDGIGRKIKDALDFQCLPSPLEGCADPAVEFGLPGDGRPCNDVCRPACSVEDTYERGTDAERRQAVPPCLEVCASGPCPGNEDRSLAYRGGHPDERDPALPVAACWQVDHQASCTQSNGAGVMVSRRQDPPPRTFARVKCRLISQHEQLCNDGRDNDEDCLVDALDPDCQGF